jgi:hypothetical protein
MVTAGWHLANPVIVKACRAGVPANGKPLPDGSRIARIEWATEKSVDVGHLKVSISTLSNPTQSGARDKPNTFLGECAGLVGRARKYWAAAVGMAVR